MPQRLGRSAVALGAVAESIAYRASRRFFRELEAASDDQVQLIQALRELEGPVAVYAHVPLCRPPLCSFCCFVKYACPAQAVARDYFKALGAELEAAASLAEGARPRALYVGGGTPSIDLEGLCNLLDRARSAFGPLEVSVEASPRDIDDDAVSELRSAGVSRLSVGLQALEGSRLRAIGRANVTVEDCLRAVEAARGRFETLNVDMVWGAACDDVNVVRAEARRALGLGADQVTFYPLLPTPGSEGAVRARREGPWHPREPQMFEAIFDEAARAGYRPQTPWTFASRASGLKDEYVIDYDQFIAVGVSGVGRVGNVVYVNTFSVSRYLKVAASGALTAARVMRARGLDLALYSAESRLFGLSRPEGPLGPLAAPLRLAGRLRGPESDVGVLYVIHRAQRGVYRGVNELREWGMRVQL